jgi:hypothetical protein
MELEELQPSPGAHRSHLARIVDSDLVPRRGRERSGVLNGPAAMARIQPDFLGMETPAASTRPDSLRTAMAGSAMPPIMPSPGLEPSPTDPPGNLHSSDQGSLEHQRSETLPAIEIAANADAPAPAAPAVGGDWRLEPNRPRLADPRNADTTPRTLEAIDFGNRSEPRHTPALVRFRGPLVIGFGLLLVLFAGVAIRRQAAARR